MLLLPDSVILVILTICYNHVDVTNIITPYMNYTHISIGNYVPERHRHIACDIYVPKKKFIYVFPSGL